MTEWVRRPLQPNLIRVTQNLTILGALLKHISPDNPQNGNIYEVG